ncbi:hypothetical protein GE061_007604 [Apolygus lucorum]|uniref:Uncharacterized protein n=1 Tax=Apolygus lucorum TaxID=248454 RepID=A0A6A4J5G4_APOLU|nr:hypothetical protein GE061_007604 [Apolygus lucorum]
MSPLPALLLSVFFMQILWSLGAAAEERRSDVRAVLGETTEPGFWPTRGRRSGGGIPDDFPPPPLFWVQHNRQLLPVTLCDTQMLQRYVSDPRYGLLIKDNNQIKSWMRS